MSGIVPSVSLDGPRSQDHSAHMLETSFKSQGVKFDHGVCFSKIFSDFIICFPIIPLIQELQD